MVRKAIFVAALALGAVAGSAASAAPVAPAALGQVVAPQAEQVTFWAHPYPYGYAYSRGQCWRRVHVETRRGWRWKRVWVCR